MILTIGLAAGDQGQRLPRVVGGKEPHLARGIVASRDQDEALVVGLADADAEAELLGLLVKRDRFLGFCAEPVIARAITAPMLVDLGEDDSGAVAGPHRLPDADVGDRLDVLARGDLADAQLEPLRPIVVDQSREQPSVGTRRNGAQAEIFLPFSLDRLVEDDLVSAPGDWLAIPRPVLRSRPISPPVEELPIPQRDRAVVLLDPSLHLLEQLVEQP